MTAEKPPWLRIVPPTSPPVSPFRKPSAHRPPEPVNPETQITVNNAMHQLRNPTGDPMLDQMTADLWDAFNTCIPGDLVAICRVMRNKGWTHL